MNVTPLQQKILQIVWATGGFTFGGTSRDLLRGEVPNDLDIRLGITSALDTITALSASVVSDRKADHGEAYYDKAIEFASGEKLHVKYGFCSVTDMDVNLVRIDREGARLLYEPAHLKGHPAPFAAIVANIVAKRFYPLEECEKHRQYRWKEFVDRGWRMLASGLYADNTWSPLTVNEAAE